jgi:hypothetical protein
VVAPTSATTKRHGMPGTVRAFKSFSARRSGNAGSTNTNTEKSLTDLDTQAP